MMNAFREGSKVHLDVCHYEGNCFPFFPTPQGEMTAPVPPFLKRLTFDLASGYDTFEKRQLMNMPCEMPRTDDRYQGRPYSHGYVICGRTADGSSAIGHIDHSTGKLEMYAPGPGDSVQEAQFVPRSPGSPEGDGWLLVPVCRVSQMRSDLVILDALNVAAGPVATLKLPIRVRATFHGTWVPENTLKTGLYEAGAQSQPRCRNHRYGITDDSTISTSAAAESPRLRRCGNMLEIHAEDGPDHRRRQQEHRHHREDLQDVVLVDVDHAERRVEQEVQVGAEEARRDRSWRPRPSTACAAACAHPAASCIVDCCTKASRRARLPRLSRALAMSSPLWPMRSSTLR